MNIRQKRFYESFVMILFKLEINRYGTPSLSFVDEGDDVRSISSRIPQKTLKQNTQRNAGSRCCLLSRVVMSRCGVSMYV